MRRQELHPHTAVINRTQKILSKKARLEALQWLAINFPKAFDNSVRIQPLKIGIMTEILLHSEEAAKEGFSRSKLREAVVVFTRRIDYLTCLKAREQRIDLEGNPVAQVSEEEAEKAIHKIKKRIEKSLRNSRKMQNRHRNSPAAQVPSQIASSQATASYSNPHQIERKPSYSMQEGPISPKISPTIKHKMSHKIDQDAVARIKQRLGLALKLKQKETAPVDI